VARASWSGQTTQTPAQTESGTDWLRVQAGYYNPSGGGNTSWWVSYNSVNAVASAATGAGIRSDWTQSMAMCVDRDPGSAYAKGTLYSASSSPGVPGSFSFNGTSRWYLVQIDDKGRIVGIGAEVSGGGSPVSMSCWTSFTQ
jgi:hypothetical protein